jgi:hypothetical protein
MNHPPHITGAEKHGYKKADAESEKQASHELTPVSPGAGRLWGRPSVVQAAPAGQRYPVRSLSQQSHAKQDGTPKALSADRRTRRLHSHFFESNQGFYKQERSFAIPHNAISDRWMHKLHPLGNLTFSSSSRVAEWL